MPRSSRFSQKDKYHSAMASKSSSDKAKSDRSSMGSSKPSTPAVVTHSTSLL